jgi:DNA-dependent RNA polymerase auxiliary subunit epsilon
MSSNISISITFLSLAMKVKVWYNTFMQKQQPAKDKTTVYIPPDVRERLKASAKLHRRSFNAELVWALEQYLASVEQEKKP